MKQPFFDTTTLAATGGESKVLAALSCIRFKSVVGTVTAKFNSAGPIRISSGDVFEVPLPLTWERVEVITESGASVVVIYGLGSFGGGGGGGSAANLTTGDGAPTLPPEDAAALAFYYDYTSAALWTWNTNTQTWV